MDLDQRISTGVPNLDSLIEGGIPRGFTVMVAGSSGTGKTILGSQFIYNGLTNQQSNENGVYISFNESKLQFYAISKKLGMDFEKFENQSRFTYLDFVSLSNDGIQDALEEILSAIRKIGAKRVVLDSFSALALSFKDKVESRITIQVFLGKIMRAERITSIVISEIPHGSHDLGNGVEESVADAIIKLEHGPDNASPIFLQVLKMRGTAINRERHVCSITQKGMLLYPKQKIRMDFPASEKRVSTGIVNLDDKIDGKGLIEGTLSAVIGASGSGKSTFAFQFIAEGIRKYQEPGIFCSLEDSHEEIRRMGIGFGYNMDVLLSYKESRDLVREKAEGEMNAEKVERNGNGLSILTYNHADYHPDAFIASLEEKIKTKRPKRLVIDGLSVYERRYKNELHDITERISSLVRKYQLTTLVTLLGAQKDMFQVTEMNLSHTHLL